MDQKKEYEEFTVISSFRSWVLLIAFSILIMSWGMFIKMMVGKEHSRTWDFGTLPDVPAESSYSTVKPPVEANVPLQIQRLPEAYYDANNVTPSAGISIMGG
jgi:hypothetical protein